MATSSKKPRHLLFDAVGTLMHPWPPPAEVYRAAGDARGCHLSTEEIATRFKAAFRQYAATRPGELPPPTNERNERDRWRAIVSQVFHEFAPHHEALFETLWQHFARSEHWRLFDDVLETWQRLEAMHVRVGIASNFDERLFGICRDLLPMCDAANLFVSSDVGYAKPHPEFFRAIERRWGKEPAELTLVGDDVTNDYDGARSAGWRAVLLVREGADYSGDAIRSLREVLLGW